MNRFLKISLIAVTVLALLFVGVILYFFNGCGISEEDTLDSEIQTLFVNEKGDTMGINSNGDTINITEEPYYMELVAPEVLKEFQESTKKETDK